MSSGVLFLRNQNLRRRHILGHLTGGRFPTPPALQWFFILIIIREIDNSIGWSYGEESGSEIASQSTKNGVKNTVPGFEVAASSISWSSARAEVSEVAALQLQRISRLTSVSTRDKVRTRIRKYEQHGYPYMVGMDTFIFGKSLIGFDEAALGCFGAFSVGTEEVV